jgi:hypothetical protein
VGSISSKAHHCRELGRREDQEGRQDNQGEGDQPNFGFSQAFFPRGFKIQETEIRMNTGYSIVEILETEGNRNIGEIYLTAWNRIFTIAIPNTVGGVPDEKPMEKTSLYTFMPDSGSGCGRNPIQKLFQGGD